MDTLTVDAGSTSTTLTIDLHGDQLAIEVGTDSELDILVGADEYTVSGSVTTQLTISSDGVTALDLTPPEETTLVISEAEPGPPGPAGGAPTPVVFDLVAAPSFATAHGFGYDPDVQLVAAGRRVYAGADYPDQHTVHLEFLQPFTGKVILR